MKGKLLLISVCMNLLLTGLAVHYLRGSLVAQVPSAQHERTSKPPSSIRAAPTGNIAEPQTTYVTNLADWTTIESADLATYITNLRGVGCPERTIREIIVADVWKQYAVKSAHVPLASGFWSCGRTRAAAVRERNDQLRKLDEEKRILLNRLLGASWHDAEPPKRDDLTEQAIGRFLLGPLPDGMAVRILAALETAGSEDDDVRARLNDIVLPSDIATRRRNFDDLTKKLLLLMGEGPYQEFVLRTAAMALRDSQLKDAEVTSAELRGMCQLYVATHGARFWEFLHDLGADADDLESEDAEFLKQTKAFLGDARYAELERSKDPAFLEANKLAEANNLPADTANRIYEVKSLLDEESQKLRVDGALSDSDRKVRWQELQDLAVVKVQGLMGDKAYAEYLRGAGAWLTNRFVP